MKDKKTEQERLENKGSDQGPMRKEDVPKNPDNKIDQDFPGYPHNPSRYETVNPGSSEEKETADLHEKDGEKRNYNTDKEKGPDGISDSDGSGNAFDGTERVRE